MTRSKETPSLDFESLAQRLSGISDFGMRAGVVRSYLQNTTPERLQSIVCDGQRAIRAGDAAAQDVFAALGASLEDQEFDRLRALAALRATMASESATARYLVPEGQSRGEGERASSPVPDFGAGRPLTLGERKSIARGRDPHVLARVLRDPHPSVIAVLLGNPALVEAQVVRLCARRPIDAGVLREVYRHERWTTRAAVRLALIQNPYCPLEVSVRLAPLVNAAERRRVAQSTDVPEPVRLACAELERESVHVATPL